MCSQFGASFWSVLSSLTKLTPATKQGTKDDKVVIHNSDYVLTQFNSTPLKLSLPLIHTAIQFFLVFGPTALQHFECVVSNLPDNTL